LKEDYMICYKDITVCSFWKECKDGKTCWRALTEKVWDAAEKEGLPICQFLDKPDCFKEEEI